MNLKAIGNNDFLIALFDQFAHVIVGNLIQELLFEPNRIVQELLESIERAIVIDYVGHDDALANLPRTHVFSQYDLLAVVNLI